MNNLFNDFHCKALRPLMILMTFLLGHPAYGTPPSIPEWPEPVYAYIVFSKFPDHDGKFEIEIYCEARYAIEWLSLELTHSEEITLDKPVPAYSASSQKGENKVWRYTGRVHPYEDTLPSLTLYIQYRFPYQAIREDIEAKYAMDHPDRKFLLEQLEKFKGKTETILKALPVQIPEKVAD